MVDRHTKNDRYGCVIDTSAGAIVYRHARGALQFLLVRPTSIRNAWGVPKGHVEKGENFSQTAVREVLEETGIQVSLEEALPPIYDFHNRELRSKRVFLFLAQPTTDDEPAPIDGENVDARWHFVENLPPIHVYQHDAIVHARRYLNFKLTGIVPTSIMMVFETVLSYASALDNWLEIKKLIVPQLSPNDRKMFSRRHEVTNMQQTNTLERQLGELWEERTGRPVIWPPVHSDEPRSRR